MISELETNLINALVLGEITEEKFLRLYPINLSKNKNYLIAQTISD